MLLHFLFQSEAKPKPVAKRSYTFPGTLHQLHVFSLSFNWLNGLYVSYVIDKSDDTESRSV